MNSNQSKEIYQNENLDILLKEKFKRAQLSELKKKMPMPAELKASKVRKFGVPKFALMAASLILALGCLLVFQMYAKNDVGSYASDLLSSSTLAMHTDEQVRGENTIEIDVNNAFAEALTILQSKEGDAQKALELLMPLTMEKNKYQIESLWLAGLIELSSGDEATGKQLIEKLQAQSNYKKNDIENLLKQMN